MKFCTRCHQERTGDTRFCTVCGAELTDQAAPGATEPTQTYQIPRTPSPPDWPGPGVPSFPPAPGPGPRRAGRGRALALAAGAAVIVLAAGAGAFALVSSLHKPGPPGSSSSSRAGGTPASVVATSPPAPSATPAATTASPAPRPTPAGIVALAAGASGSPHAAQVENLFTRYFTGINTHNYSQYASTLDAGMKARNTRASFDSGYATTTDSNETIESITSAGSGLTAVVTFTARQSPSDSPDASACNHYTLTLPLVPQGQGYLITTPPPGYASYSDC